MISIILFAAMMVMSGMLLAIVLAERSNGGPLYMTNGRIRRFMITIVFSTCVMLGRLLCHSGNARSWYSSLTVLRDIITTNMHCG